MSDAQRNAALYRQRMTQTNGQIGMVSPPMRQQVAFDPQIQAPPHMPPAIASPPPPGAPQPVTKLTGSSRKIPPRIDPANAYHNLKYKEFQAAEDDEEGYNALSGVNQLVVAIVIIVALSSIFVLPKQLKVFWVVVLGLTFLIHVGFMLYKEWLAMGRKKGGDSKYAEWAAILLYCLVMIYTSVMVGMMFFFAWSLYSIANSRTNIARLDSAAMKDYHVRKSGDETEKVYV